MKISFTGDVSLTGKLKEAIINDSLKIDNEILEIFKNSDFNIINLEGPSTNKEVVFDKHIQVKNPLASIEYLKDKGVNIFNLANNHTFDADLEGFIECKNEIKKNKCQYFGAGENIDEASKVLFIENKNIKIGLVGVGSPGGKKNASNNNCGVFSDMNMSLIEKQIKYSSDNSDWTIINFHNGTEFNFYPVKYIQNKLKQFIDFGANIVIGHHPHVPQGIQNYKNGAIFYSLGNFLFDLDSHKNKKNTDLSLLTTLNFEKHNYSYTYVLTRYTTNDLSIKIIKDEKILTWYKKINERTKSKNINTYAFFDFVRSIYFNPILYKKKWANYLIFLTFFLRPIAFTTGNQREILRGFLDYLKLGFIFRFLKGKNSLSKDNEY